MARPPQRNRTGRRNTATTRVGVRARATSPANHQAGMSNAVASQLMVARRVDRDGPGSTPDLAGMVLRALGVGFGVANHITSILGLGDLRSWIAGQGLDEKNLTNLLFFARHPDMNGRRIRSDEQDLAREWVSIRDDVVRPFIRSIEGTGQGTVASGGSTEPPVVTDEPSEQGPTEPDPAGAQPGTAAPAGDRAFVDDAMRSTIDLLPEKQQARFEAIEWGWMDFPGNKSKHISKMDAEELARFRRDTSLVEKSDGHFYGKHQGDAKALFKALADNRIRVAGAAGERRVNIGKTAILDEKAYGTNPGAFDDYIESQLAYLDGHAQVKRKMLNKHAAAKFADLRAAAAADGVDITVASGFREMKSDRASAAKARNSNAVAGYSPHSLGLAMDLSLWTKSMSKTGGKFTEISTGNFKNMLRMMQTPAYKWMYMNGGQYGFYQYKQEPWHWEYNPPGFQDTFWSDDPTLKPG